jgi:hypothetical protein
LQRFEHRLDAKATLLVIVVLQTASRLVDVVFRLGPSLIGFPSHAHQPKLFSQFFERPTSPSFAAVPGGIHIGLRTIKLQAGWIARKQLLSG